MPEIEELPPTELRLMGAVKTGCRITYLVAGNGITEIDRDSLKIESITNKDGKDISKNSRGRAAWQMDRFPNISDDGKLATFSIFVATDAPTVSPNIKTSLNMKSAGKTKTARLVFKTAKKGKEQKAGPLMFSVVDNASGRVFSAGSSGTAFSGDDDDDYDYDDGEEERTNFSISMKGDKRLVAKIELEAGGKSIKSVGNMPLYNKVTYCFSSKPAKPEFTLVVTYFADIADTNVTIGK